jgi:ABC-type proline/glycine betaine transport system permease subunit
VRQMALAGVRQMALAGVRQMAFRLLLLLSDARAPGCRCCQTGRQFHWQLHWQHPVLGLVVHMVFVAGIALVAAVVGVVGVGTGVMVEATVLSVEATALAVPAAALAVRATASVTAFSGIEYQAYGKCRL